MSEPLLTKRLHISGLTPSITQTDLERRLSLFGKVKAMDGFGARDVLGDPKKFGFVTMDIGTKELAKCLNVLSGSTWKGTKLRIGEAKPDFRERLAQINARSSDPARPKRTRARNYGYPSSTLPLSPLSATAAASAPGWIVTPSGRVVRPMRMRPQRPLEPMRHELGASKVKGVNVKVKKRLKPPPVRARRRLIDPTKWDSVCLKGVFLDAVPVPLPVATHARESPSPGEHNCVREEDGEEMDADSDAVSMPLQQEHAHTISTAQQSSVAAVAMSSQMYEPTEPVDIRSEANAALTMLGKMFGDDDDWDGRESVEGMEDYEVSKAKDDRMQVDRDDVEIVPRDFGGGEERKPARKGKGKGKAKLVEDVPFGHEDKIDPTPRTSLKSLFAPMEDASFSLVNHLGLDLDLELEADILGIGAPSGTSQENGHVPQTNISASQVVPATTSIAKARSRVTLDPSHPLLFPTPELLPHPSSDVATTTHRRGTPSCFLFPSTTRIPGLHRLPSSVTFTRSPQETSESIRERWEKDKTSLTREWKKAWREARGNRRGRRAAEGDVGDGY